MKLFQKPPRRGRSRSRRPNSLRKVVAFIVLLYGIFYSVLDGSDQAQYMCVLMDEDGSGVE